MAVLNYGINSCVELEFAEGVLLGEVGIPRGQPLADLAAATTAALAEPIDYPPLARSTTPADHVVVALDRGVPQVAQVTASIVDALIDSGIDPDGITVLRSPADLDAGADNPCRLVPAPLRKRITLLTHDPADRRQLAYLAASPSGEAILINRALHDADVVLPVGCLRPDETAGYFGIHGALFPAFSDVKTLQRFRSRASLNGQGSRKRELCAEVDNVAWLLGINFTVQLIPAGWGTGAARRGGPEQLGAAAGAGVVSRGVELARVAAGQPGRGLDRRRCGPTNLGKRGPNAASGRQLCRSRWRHRRLLRSGRWPRAGHAAHGARAVARTPRRGTTARSGRPMPCPPPSSPEALQQHKVYLLSRLDPSVVEDLDVFPLAGVGRVGPTRGPAPIVHPAFQCPYVTAAEMMRLGDGRRARDCVVHESPRT